MSQWFHAQDGRQNGPVSEEELRHLVSSGTVGPDDLVWCDGMSEWVPVKTLAQFAPPAPSQVPPPPARNMVPPPPATASPYQPPASPMAARAPFGIRPGGDIDIGEALSLGWQGFSRNFLLGSVMTLLGTVIWFASSLVLGIIPILGPIAGNVLLAYPLIAGGLYAGVVAADNARGNQRPVELEDLFAAFKANYGQVVLYSLLMAAITFGTIMVIALSMVLLIPMAQEQPLLLTFAMLVLLIPLMYATLRLSFAYQLLVDKQASMGDALSGTWQITRGQVLALLALTLIIVVINSIGMLLFVVGMFPAMFLSACILGAAYRQVAGD